MKFPIHQVETVVFGSKFTLTPLVFAQSSDQIIRNTHVQYRLFEIGQDIDIVLVVFHGVVVMNEFCRPELFLSPRRFFVVPTKEESKTAADLDASYVSMTKNYTANPCLAVISEKYTSSKSGVVASKLLSGSSETTLIWVFPIFNEDEITW